MRSRTARVLTFEEGVLQAVDRNPGTCVWAVTGATRVSRTTTGRSLKSIKCQRVQLLEPDDHSGSVATRP